MRISIGLKWPHCELNANRLRFVKYTVILERETDGGFVASVPVLPGCISRGDSRDEAIDLYPEDCLLAGNPVPQEDSREYVELLTGTS